MAKRRLYFSSALTVPGDETAGAIRVRGFSAFSAAQDGTPNADVTLDTDGSFELAGALDYGSETLTIRIEGTGADAGYAIGGPVTIQGDGVAPVAAKARFSTLLASQGYEGLELVEDDPIVSIAGTNASHFSVIDGRLCWARTDASTYGDALGFSPSTGEDAYALSVTLDSGARLALAVHVDDGGNVCYPGPTPSDVTDSQANWQFAVWFETIRKTFGDRCELRPGIHNPTEATWELICTAGSTLTGAIPAPTDPYNPGDYKLEIDASHNVTNGAFYDTADAEGWIRITSYDPDRMAQVGHMLLRDSSNSASYIRIHHVRFAKTTATSNALEVLGNIATGQRSWWQVDHCIFDECGLEFAGTSAQSECIFINDNEMTGANGTSPTGRVKGYGIQVDAKDSFIKRNRMRRYGYDSIRFAIWSDNRVSEISDNVDRDKHTQDTATAHADHCQAFWTAARAAGLATIASATPGALVFGYVMRNNKAIRGEAYDTTTGSGQGFPFDTDTSFNLRMTRVVQNNIYSGTYKNAIATNMASEYTIVSNNTAIRDPRVSSGGGAPTLVGTIAYPQKVFNNIFASGFDFVLDVQASGGFHSFCNAIIPSTAYSGKFTSPLATNADFNFADGDGEVTAASIGAALEPVHSRLLNGPYGRMGASETFYDSETGYWEYPSADLTFPLTTAIATFDADTNTQLGDHYIEYGNGFTTTVVQSAASGTGPAVVGGTGRARGSVNANTASACGIGTLQFTGTIFAETELEYLSLIDSGMGPFVLGNGGQITSTGTGTALFARYTYGSGVQLFKRVGGATTQLGSTYTGYTATVGAPVWLRIEADPIEVSATNNVRVYLDTGSGYGSPIIEATYADIDEMRQQKGVYAGFRPSVGATAASDTTGVQCCTCRIGYVTEPEMPIVYTLDAQSGAAGDDLTATKTNFIQDYVVQTGHSPASSAKLSGTASTVYATSADSVYAIDAEADSADQLVTAMFTYRTDIATDKIMVIARAVDGAQTYYFLEYDRALGASGRYTLGKMVAGTRTDLSTLDQGYSSGDRQLSIELIGDRIIGYIDNSTVRNILGPVTDASISAAGRPGFGILTAQTSTTGRQLSAIRAMTL